MTSRSPCKANPGYRDSWRRGGIRGRSTAADERRRCDVILHEIPVEPPAAIVHCWRAAVRLAMRGDARARPIIFALRALERRWRRGWAR